MVTIIIPITTIPQLAVSERRISDVLGCMIVPFLIRLLEGPSEPEEKRNDHATEEQRHTPSPQRHFLRRKRGAQHHSTQCGEHDRHLLAPRLPTDVEAFVARRCDL